VELDAELTLDPDSMLGRALDVSGSCPALVRVSRSVGLPGRWPDLLGIAVRVSSRPRPSWRPGYSRVPTLEEARAVAHLAVTICGGVGVG